MSAWDIWKGIHDDEDQIKRLESAKQAECTPISINSDDCCGKFSGKRGKYETTLEECTCFDFKSREKPCKHMYRLAIELSLVNETVKSDKSKIKSPPPAESYTLQELISKTNDLSDELQILFKTILKDSIYNGKVNIAIVKTETNQILIDRDILKSVDDYKTLLTMLGRNELNALLDKEGIIGFKRNMSHAKLSEWCCQNAPNLPLNKYIAITAHEYVYKNRSKMYQYLKDKYPEHEYSYSSDKIILIEDDEWIYKTSNQNSQLKTDSKVPHDNEHNLTFIIKL